MTDAPAIDPASSALLVMDYQLSVVRMVDGADALVAQAASAIATARAAGITVGYVRVAFDDQDYAAIPGTNKTFTALVASRRLHDTDPDTVIDARVGPEPGDIIVRKVRVGAFSTTDLDEQLRARGITTLILAGISTSGVVLSTVRAAADLDYRVYVLEDACADTDPVVHETLTQRVYPRQCYVISVADLPALLPAA
ncbi:MAG TPA: cysteine hydrolase [Streptosporangiaceae bacterium]|nr:cysteine hydrolase [Streptosporangiaceae bacterium]